MSEPLKEIVLGHPASRCLILFAALVSGLLERLCIWHAPCKPLYRKASRIYGVLVCSQQGGDGRRTENLIGHWCRYRREGVRESPS